MIPAPSARLQSLPPYIFATISQRIGRMQAEGLDVIRLDIGSPDLPPGDHVTAALAASAAQPGNHGYAGYRGTASFRQAVARYYQKRFGVTLDPETEVLPLLGSKEGIVNLMMAYLEEDSIVLVPSIGYPAYAMGARLVGAQVCYVPMPEENNFLLDLDAIDPNTWDLAKLLWINYPNNPTGVAADLDYYASVVEQCREHQVLLASDNPYCDVTFDGYIAPSVLQVPGAKQQTVEFMSFSKSFNMAGWRLGAAVGSATALKQLLNVKSNIDSGHFKAVYDAGIAAIDDTPEDWFIERNAIYERRRDMLLTALPEVGLSARPSIGTLYVWAKVEHMPASTYVERALTEALVSIAPGAAYGPGGEGYVRLSLSVADERVEEGIERLKNWYNR